MGQKVEKIEVTKKEILSSPFDILPDLIIMILRYGNSEGLDLKTYRNQIFVCKQWNQLGIESITTIDLIALKQTTVHRKCTLLAHIFADYPLHRFPNLTSLKISFAGISLFEFYEKLNCPEKRSFEENFFSDDKRLDKIESNLKQTINEFNDLEKDPNVGLLGKVTKGIGFLVSVGWEMAWFSHLSNSPILPKERIKQMKEINDHLEHKIITFLTDFAHLDSLILGTCFNFNLAFITKIPTLRYLHIIPAEAILGDRDCKILIEPLSHLHQPHKIEILRIGGHHSPENFNNWDTNFPSLKELAVSIDSLNDTNEINTETKLTSLVDNLPNLEILKLMGTASSADIKPFQMIHKLTKLKRLNLTRYFVRDSDLIDIAKIDSLKELVLLKVEGDSSFLELVDMRREQWKGYSNEALDLFKLTRPDVVVTIENSPSIPTVFDEITITSF